MKTKEQINEELIEYYKIRVKELEGQLEKLKAKAWKMEKEFKISPSDKWYLQYLMGANASLEREVEKRQEIVEQYQRHYNKFGKLYLDYERNRGLADADILGDTDTFHRGHQRYPQPKEKKPKKVIE